MSEKSSGGNGCACFGCLGFIAFSIVVWGLIFGWTYQGTHHSLDCNMNNGVEIKEAQSGR